MVGRCPVGEPVEAVVVDLDGTLLRVNSFHIYLREGLIHMLRHGRLLKFSVAAAWLAARVLRFTDHWRMKQRVSSLIGTAPGLLDKVADKLRPQIRKPLLDYINRCRQRGQHVVIATAAHGEYVRLLFPELPVIAAPAGELPLHGDLKLRAVRGYLATHRLTPGVFLTDHPDDLPLLKSLQWKRTVIVSDRTDLSNLA